MLWIYTVHISKSARQLLKAAAGTHTSMAICVIKAEQSRSETIGGEIGYQRPRVSGRLCGSIAKGGGRPMGAS